MQDNQLAVRINKPPQEVFLFAITPPNSTLWIPSVIKEKTSEWPIKKGTIYRLKNEDGQWSEVTVIAIEKNKMVEWVSKDKTYHCRYKFRTIDKNTTELEYYEWVEKGELESPFTQEILDKLKLVLERK